MTKRIIYIILGALVIAALIALAWWWFFHRASATPTPPSSNFGTASSTSPGALGSGEQTNVGSTLPGGTGTNGSQGNTATGSGTTQPSQGAPTYGLQTVYNPTYGVYTIPGTPGSVVTTITQGPGQTVTTGGAFTTSGAPGVPGFPAPGVAGSSAGSSGGAGTAGVAGVPGVVWLSGTPAGAGTPGVSTPVIANNTTPGTINSGSGTISNNLAPGTVFNPLGTNGINSSNPSGGVIPNIGGGSTGGGSNGGLGIAGALIGAAAAGVITCGAAQAISTVATTLGFGTGTGAAVTGATPGTVAQAPAAGISVQTENPTGTLAITGAIAGLSGVLGAHSGNQGAANLTNTFWGCIARTVAKIALQQITASVVNWINSGFSGSSSFVSNTTQFFQNVADNAAGAYIKGSGLAFLCSPFSLQIKIAIAQSYANQNAQSCTLTQIIGNVNNFMNGDFSSGGWAGMLSFTGTPTNNPYGAFAYASIGLQTAVNTAVNQKQTDLNRGQGFLSFQQQQGCTISPTAPPSGPNTTVTTVAGNASGDGAIIFGSGTGTVPTKSVTTIGANTLPSGVSGPVTPTEYQVCNLVTSTPGKVIADSLNATQNSVFTELDVAQSFDQIISALVTQLITRIQGGLSNLNNGGAGYESNFESPDELQAQSDAQTLLTQMQGVTGVVTQYAATEQGAISDIESAQQQLSTLYNCWNSAAAASSTNASVAAQNAGLASTTLNQFNAQIGTYNTNITNANNGIATIQNLESAALSAASEDDITTITTQYNAAQAQGQILGPADLTNAQDDRTTLDGQLTALNASTLASQQQCNAFH